MFKQFTTAILSLFSLSVIGLSLSLITLPTSAYAGGPISVTSNSISEPAGNTPIQGYAPLHVEFYNAETPVIGATVTIKADSGWSLTLAPGEQKSVPGDITTSTTYSIVGSNPTASSKITILTPLSQTLVKPTSVSLTWGAALNVTNYIVYRSTAGNTSAYQKVGSATGTSFTDTSVQAGVTYSYYFEGQDASGTRVMVSNYLIVTTPTNQPPTAPTSLTASLTGTTAQLQWSPSTDEDGISDYLVYSGSTQLGVAYSTVYTVENLEPGKTYTFSVKGRDKNNLVSAASNVATVVVEGTTATPKATSTPKASPTPEATSTPNVTTPTLTQINVDGESFTPSPLNVLKVGTGKTIHLEGTAKPNTALTLAVYSQKTTYSITPDATGAWSYDLVTTDLESGSHHLSLQQGSGQETDVLQFSLVDTSQLNSTTPTTTETKNPLRTVALIGIILASLGVLISGIALFIPFYKKRKAAKLSGNASTPPQVEDTPVNTSSEDVAEPQLPDLEQE